MFRISGVCSANLFHLNSGKISPHCNGMGKVAPGCGCATCVRSAVHFDRAEVGLMVLYSSHIGAPGTPRQRRQARRLSTDILGLEKSFCLRLRQRQRVFATCAALRSSTGCPHQQKQTALGGWHYNIYQPSIYLWKEHFRNLKLAFPEAELWFQPLCVKDAWTLIVASSCFCWSWLLISAGVRRNWDFLGEEAASALPRNSSFAAALQASLLVRARVRSHCAPETALSPPDKEQLPLQTGVMKANDY